MRRGRRIVNAASWQEISLGRTSRREVRRRCISPDFTQNGGRGSASNVRLADGRVLRMLKWPEMERSVFCWVRLTHRVVGRFQKIESSKSRRLVEFPMQLSLYWLNTPQATNPCLCLRDILTDGKRGKQKHWIGYGT